MGEKKHVTEELGRRLSADLEWGASKVREAEEEAEDMDRVGTKSGEQPSVPSVDPMR